MYDNLIFDLENITNFIFHGNDTPSNGERTNDVEITESYVYDDENSKLSLVTKDVREVKSNENSAQSSIRYDLIKLFVEILDSAVDTQALSLGQSIVYNTMQSYELIKELKNNN